MNALKTANHDLWIQVPAIEVFCSRLEHHQADGDELADRRNRGASVEQLVETERRRPRVWPAQPVEHCTNAVQRAAGSQ